MSRPDELEVRERGLSDANAGRRRIVDRGRWALLIGRPSLWLSGVAVALACAGSAVEEEQPANSVQSLPLEAQGPRWTAVAPRLLREPTGEPAVDEAVMRRNYGPSDMKIGDCTQIGPEGSIVGKECPNGYVVFGPYVAAPAKTNVQVSFEIFAREALSFSSDIVTDVDLTRGRVESQQLAAGEVRKLAYEVYFPDAAKSLEARIWVSAKKPVAFEIRQFGVRVQ
jgi:hypothetical protein